MHRIERDNAPEITLVFEGKPLTAHQGDTVAAALLAAGHKAFRTTVVNGTSRGPFCMMGVCFECLVEIDGVANRQACMTEARNGMRVKRQLGANDISMGPSDGSDKRAGS